MIYLYAIIDQPGGVLPSLAGLENAPLSEIVYQDIAGVYTSFTSNTLKSGYLKESTTLDPNEENLWKHEAVLEALMPDHSVLPLRFGSAFAGDSVLLALLQDKYASFSANLRRVQGCVELSLRMNWQNKANQLPVICLAAQTRRQAPAMSGKDYMQTLLKARQQEHDLHQQIETQARELLHNLDRLAAENTHVVCLTPYPSMKAAYLLAQSKVPLFRQEVGNLATLHPDLHFALTGPWPPYNFIAN
jgi:hypothetical protein